MNAQKTLSKSLTKTVRNRKNRGAASVEYIIVLVFIAIAGIALFQKFGTDYKKKIETSTTTFQGVNP